MPKKPDSIDTRIAKGNLKRRDSTVRDREAGVRGSVAIGVPIRPKSLPEEAQGAWKRTITLLKAMGIVTVSDETIIAAYAIARTRWEESERKISAEGTSKENRNGNKVPNPELKIAGYYLSQVILLSKELGLTPTSREKLSIRAKAEPKKGVGRYIHE